MSKSIKVWDGSVWQNVGTSFPDTSTFVTESAVAELAQDAVGNNIGSGLTYNDSTGSIGINPGAMLNAIVGGTSGNSYGLVGSSAYLDVIDTNGYNKEIELDIASVESKLITDGFATQAYVNLIQYGTAISGTTYTLSGSDLGKLIETTSSSSITITIPSDPTDSTFPIGSSVEFRQMGTGRITFSPTSPATMVSTDSYAKTRTQYSSIVLEKRASNAWILAGDIDA